MSCSCHKDIFPRWTSLVALIALAAAIALIALFGRFYGNGRADEDKTTVAAQPREPEAAVGDTAGDDAVEPEPKKDWTPPRFAERQRDRNQMADALARRYNFADEAVMEAMRNVPRHSFVRPEDSRSAYEDSPLPIGHGQTISQPYIVAEMTRLLLPVLKPDSKVLEVGTGSGYQAAVLTEFTRNVFTIEIIGALAESAEKLLKELGYEVAIVKHADGFYGWPEHSPFDAIIVTCAAGQIPPPLLEQLAPGGRMVIPVGPVYATQSLMIVDKDKDGRVTSRSHMPVRFVPLIREDPAAK